MVVYAQKGQDLDELAAALARHRVTVLWLTAGLFHAMAEEQAPKAGRWQRWRERRRARAERSRGIARRVKQGREVAGRDPRGNAAGPTGGMPFGP